MKIKVNTLETIEECLSNSQYHHMLAKGRAAVVEAWQMHTGVEKSESESDQQYLNRLLANGWAMGELQDLGTRVLDVVWPTTMR